VAKRKLSIYKDDGNNWLKGLLFAQHVEGEGKKLFKEICSRDLEGIVAKRKWGFTKTMEMLGSRSRTGPILRPKEGTSC